MALEDYKHTYEVTSRKGGHMMPMVVFMHYHNALMNLVEKDKLNAKSVKEIRVKNKEIIEAIKLYQEDK